MSRLAQTATVLIVLALVFGGCGGDHSGHQGQSSEFNGDTAFELPDAAAQKLPAYGPDVKGKERPLRPTSGQLMIVFFGFTNCPDVCPLTMGATGAAVRLLPAAQQKQVEGAMVSVDPARDSGSVLQKYVGRYFNHQRAWGFRTDDMAALRKVERAFGADSEVEAGHDHGDHAGHAAGADYDVAHSPFRYAVNRDGEVMLMWQQSATSEEIAADLKKLLAQVNGS